MKNLVLVIVVIKLSYKILFSQEGILISLKKNRKN